jgi:hypothetical protein
LFGDFATEGRTDDTAIVEGFLLSNQEARPQKYTTRLHSAAVPTRTSLCVFVLMWRILAAA